MVKVIINADDFGYSKGVNRGIIDAHLYGILTSTTMMTNMPGFEQGVELAKLYPSLGVGIHLVLTCGRPVVENINRTLVDDLGNFKKISHYQNPNYTFDAENVYAEWKGQIEKFLITGLIPTHLDSHHHINSFGPHKEVFLRLAKEFGLPVRNNMNLSTEERQSTQTTDCFLGEINDSMFDQESMEIYANQFKSIEVMCHPAYIDAFLKKTSSFVYPRIEELDLLTNPALVKLFRESETLILCNYCNL